MSTRDEESNRAASVSPKGMYVEVAPDIEWGLLQKTNRYPLKPGQKETLRQVVWKNGGLGALSVGQGKSLLYFLIPYIFGFKTEDVVLLHPQNLERTLRLQYKKFKEHFHLVEPQYVSYEVFQGANFHRNWGKPGRGTQFNPKLILADECHGLKKESSTRFRRVARYLADNPEVMFFPATGTVTSRSLTEYAHIGMLALREGNPVPSFGRGLRAWSRILDADKDPTEPDWSYFKPLLDRYGIKDSKHFQTNIRVERARGVFKAHLEQTPGMTIIGESSVASTLYLKRHDEIHIPDRIKKVLKYMDEYKRLPAEGDYFETDSAAAKARVEVLQGFYYQWIWDESVSLGDITDWKLARSDWNRAVRAWMGAPPLPDVDSPAILAQTIEQNPDRIHRVDRNLVDLYYTWTHQKKTVPPPDVQGVWLDDYLVEWAHQWIRSNPAALVWYRPIIMGQKLGEALNVPCYGAGSPPPEEGMDDTGSHSAVSSLAHRRGLNLQAWRHHLVLSPIAGGGVYEQLLGRSHRSGQTQDVRFEIVTHHPAFKRPLMKAIEDAKYTEKTTGMQQKLLYGAWI